MGDELSREAILTALSRLSDELKRDGVHGELCLFGGAVMVLAFNARPGTKDVDAVFQPSENIRRAAQSIGEELGLPGNWLNDGVKGWTSSHGETTETGMPQFPHLHHATNGRLSASHESAGRSR